MHITVKGGILSLLLAAGASLPAFALPSSQGRNWTLDDVVLVPEVTELALSDDGRFALYAVEAADIAANRPRSTLRVVDLNSGLQREVANVDSADLLRRIPGSPDWSALLDIGEGVQLYRIDRSGNIRPLMLNPETVLMGQADMALPTTSMAPPHRVGVLAYDWSPDGKWLWYSLLKPETASSHIRFDGEVIAARSRRRSQIEAKVEFRLRDPQGDERLIMTRPTSDRIAYYYGANIIWRGDDIHFRIENQSGADGSGFETRIWDRSHARMRTVSHERDVMTGWLMSGPHGGQLSTTGTGDHYALVETLPDGQIHKYGKVSYTIGDPRSAGFQVSTDGRSVIVGTRSIDDPHYGLALISTSGVRAIESHGSLTRCDFSADLVDAICIREGVSQPPELVRIDTRHGRVIKIGPISPRHQEIAPLTIRPRTWMNRLGYKATGFVILPRGYQKGQRYPTIIITHGSDADERFANIAIQWNYPAQIFAESGYVVLLVNDPAWRQSPELWAVFNAWLRGSGPPEPLEVQRLGWVNGVYSFEDAVTELAAEGIVDLDRVGIAGFSRGSQMVNVALTHSKMFRAASSGDGSFLEPFGYPLSAQSYDAIFGGPPFGDYIENYRRFSPSLNGKKVCAALLQQVALPMPGAIDFYEALRARHVPAQLSYYLGESPASDETHAFHIPSNRVLAMRENLAWFDYWLRDRRGPENPFPERFAAWDRMASDIDRPCGTSLPGKAP